MKLIELTDEKETRSVDLVDKNYDLCVGIDLCKTYDLEEYDNFHNFLLENMYVIEDLGDKIIVDTEKFINSNREIFKNVLHSEDMEEMINEVFNMETGNCGITTYDIFSENLYKYENNIER